ncbi:hypothetical protein [uncultured Gimesia sp.]|uniref:hypothetical protein n=1 Tax=uncultured Gimesia sp. TaxID=1678688 RepID=UPI0030DC30CF|tara:strand:- start:2365 stop:2574 length:210 start_codon:yes stop_codon:yes gene_type:complete
MLDNLPLNGKKTYVVADVTVIYFVCGILLGDMPIHDAMVLIGGALGGKGREALNQTYDFTAGCSSAWEW